MPYTQQVFAVLVNDRHRAIAADLADARRFAVRRRAAAVIYALAKAVTVIAVALDDEPLCSAGERGR